MTEYWVSQGNHWCEYCKCWMNNNPKTIAIHTQGPKHKQNVEDRMRTIRRNAAGEKREEDLAKRTMASIEAAARRAYEKDLQEGRPEDMLGPQLPGDGNMGPGHRLPQAQTAIKTTDRDSGGSHAAAASVATPEAASSIQWVWDSVSGYWYDDVSKFFYDSASGMYCNPSTGAWQEQAPPPPKKRAPPPPPPKRQSSNASAAVAGLENVPQSMRAAGARAAGEACAVCGGSTVGCPACSGTAKAVGVANPKSASGGVDKAAPKPKPSSAFDLGYGTLHPKFLQAAKKKENAAAFKRARSPPKEISEKEKEEIARREAAREEWPAEQTHNLD
eukprot:CAMPEP_0114233958 /NCGR_PEP_ID=MMETSP0058-20121206/5458_1 /TAXON_ID=36894 /ORGANISM="Pyramimonas parkeae, CCMP726" /LENGTH=330 /DNA_ID=CAMNT_0001345615 /DNA_START=41 /DNA_END=1034 /DNA_ORIENTATION=+